MNKLTRTLALTIGLTIVGVASATAAPSAKPVAPTPGSVQNNQTPAPAKPVSKAQTAAVLEMVKYANALTQYVANHGGDKASKNPTIKDVIAAIKGVPVPKTLTQTQTATSVFLSPKAFPVDKLEITIVKGSIAFMSNGFKMPNLPAPKGSVAPVKPAAPSKKS